MALPNQNNMASIPKLIFRAYDFMNNKILNAKVDTPTEDNQIANLKTVNDSVLYDTQKAQTYNNSFKHSWLTELYQKSLKTIFDDLFFPRILPIYNNPLITPTILVENSCIISDPISGNVKNIIFIGKQLNATFKFDIALNDRLTTENPGYIEIISGGSTQQVFYTGNFSDLIGEINFDFVYTPGITIKYKQDFSESQEKQDSYGDNYISPEFSVITTLEIDIIQILLINSIFLDSPMISNIPRLQEEIPTYLDADILSLFTKTNEITIAGDNEVIYDILIPTSIVYKNQAVNYPIYAVISHEFINKPGGHYQKLNDILLNYDWLTYYTKNLEYVIVEDIEYIKCQFNFGYFSENTKITLFFGKPYNTSYFI
jgi:hypothetical protein